MNCFEALSEFATKHHSLIDIGLNAIIASAAFLGVYSWRMHERHVRKARAFESSNIALYHCIQSIIQLRYALHITRLGVNPNHIETYEQEIEKSEKWFDELQNCILQLQINDQWAAAAYLKEVFDLKSELKIICLIADELNREDDFIEKPEPLTELQYEKLYSKPFTVGNDDFAIELKRKGNSFVELIKQEIK